MGCREFDVAGIGRKGAGTMHREREGDLVGRLIEAVDRTCFRNNCNCPGAKGVRQALDELKHFRAAGEPTETTA